MSILQILDIGLAGLVLAVAAWTVFAREAFAAVVGFVAYGLLLSLVWVRLFAVDVALTEAAIGSGVTGVLLIGAAGRLRKLEASGGDEMPSCRCPIQVQRSLPKRLGTWRKRVSAIP
jgi:uncharacterized MnhB-related membrane protein